MVITFWKRYTLVENDKTLLETVETCYKRYKRVRNGVNLLETI